MAADAPPTGGIDHHPPAAPSAQPHRPQAAPAPPQTPAADDLTAGVEALATAGLHPQEVEHPALAADHTGALVEHRRITAAD